MKKILIVIVLFIGLISFSQNSKFKTYRVSAHETISSIARKLGITPYDLLKLNPDADNGIHIDEVLIIPNKDFKVVGTNVSTSKITVSAQSNPIKRKDSIVDGYIYHTVKPLENVYSLSRKFKVSKRKVRRLNKLNKNSEISVGQVLKFPTDKKNCCTKKLLEVAQVNQVIVEETTHSLNDEFIKYIVKPKDTFYSLAKVYNTTEVELKGINPILNDGLKVGLEIKIPNKKINSLEADNQIKTQLDSLQVNTQPKYIIHKVEPKEGFFRLKQIYGVTKEEVVKANTDLDLSGGLKLGMELKIPTKIDESLLIEGKISGKLLNVVLMMPFNADKNVDFSEDSKKAISLNKKLDFYLGSLMALDSLKKKGLSVNLKVIDTKSSDFVVNKFLNEYDFTSTNLVIAPINFNRLKIVAMAMSTNNIPVLSPVSKKDCSLIGTKNIVQNTPSNSVVSNKMLDYILANVSNQHIVIIADEKTPNTQKKDFNIGMIKSKLLKHDSINDVTIIRMNEGYIKRELFVDNIKEKKENWVVLASNQENLTSIALQNLAVFPKEFNITLFSLSKPKKLIEKDYQLNSEKNMSLSTQAYYLKSNYLNKLNFQYPEVNFIDEDLNLVRNFVKQYQTKNGSIPTQYSFKGFDTTYDALIRIANFDNIEQAFKAGKSIRLINQFNYEQNQNLSFTNNGVFIVRYHDYNLEKVY